MYLHYRVDYDSVVDKEPDWVMPFGSFKRMKSSTFAKVYEKILADKNVDAARVSVYGFEDVDELKYRKKLPPRRY